MKLKCKVCGHEWTYKGHAEYWTSCPNCRSNVRVAYSNIKRKEMEK